MTFDAKIMSSKSAERIETRGLSREALTRLQFDAFGQLMGRTLESNDFYRRKLAGLAADKISNRRALAALPMTLKSELVGTGTSAFAANLTFDPHQYVRFHRTSGTHGHPMAVWDTAEDWKWWIDAWQYVLDVAGVDETDIALMAFSFGPFIGFWSAFDAAIARGLAVIPTGAMTTRSRLELLLSCRATVVFCTPSYALHLAEVAADQQIDLRASCVKKMIVAGEPGGSQPALRTRIENAWDAQVIDHAGASEVGPWGFADDRQRGLYVNEAHFLPELIRIEDQTLIPLDELPQAPEQSGDSELLAELVLTTLGRYGCPVIRYRTGDLVRPCLPNASDACQFLFLDGGVLGRTDDMMIIRGVNIFPSSVEAILREIDEVVEFRMTAFSQGAMDQLKVEIESDNDVTQRVGTQLNNRLGLRVNVTRVENGALPRFEGKGRRFVDQRRT